MADRKIAWGTLGTAEIALGRVIPALAAAKATRMVAIASRDDDKAAATAAKLGLAKSYGSYEALLDDPEIEVVYNALPNPMHVEWSIRAMEKGKHVLCEKPISITASEADMLVEARERTGRQIAEAFMVRHHPQWRRAREYVRSGRLGKLRAIHSFFSNYNVDPGNIRNRPEMGGGAVYDLGCYIVMSGRFFFGAEPRRLIGTMDRDPVFGTDRMTSGLIDFDEGQLSFTCSTQLSPYHRIQLMGTERRLEIVRPYYAPPEISAALVIDDGNAFKGGELEWENFSGFNHYTLQCDAFSQAILTGTSVEFPIEDAIANMRALDALFRSAETGRWEQP